MIHIEEYAECPSCGRDLHYSADLYEIDGLFVCEKCFREWLVDYAKTNPSEVAEQLNVPIISNGWREQC